MEPLPVRTGVLPIAAPRTSLACPATQRSGTGARTWRVIGSNVAFAAAGGAVR